MASMSTTRLDPDCSSHARMRSLFILLCVSPLIVNGGSNGLAVTPPMSWRSWNQYGWYINESVILAAATGLVDGTRAIKNRPANTTLLDLGFNEVGMDEGWAACAPQPGPNPHGRNGQKRMNVTKPFGKEGWAFHRPNSDGTISPVVDTILFPDMKGMVDEIHTKGLRAGWYLNDCLSYCFEIGDTCGDECNAGDVLAWHAYGFDSVKLDGCSHQHNMSLWAQLLNATGTKAIIENCGNTARPTTPVAEGGCPDYHVYRTSGDIRNTYCSWMSNAQTVQHYAENGLTGPTCWAYPDMNMIGVTGETPDEGPPVVDPSITEQRTHFGLWCILSSPLTISFDLSNKVVVDRVWPIVTNVMAIGINQAWAGKAGGVYAQDTNHTTTLLSCDGGYQPLSNFTLPAWQAWYKPLPGGTAAVMVVNQSPEAIDTAVVFADIPGLLPPQPCDTAQFPVDLGQTQCFGLVPPKRAPPGGSTWTEDTCCAECARAASACDTWQLCPRGAGCAGKTGVPLVGGCYIGLMKTCKNTTNGWISRARAKDPIPPPPPPPSNNRKYIVTDVWSQTQVGTYTDHFPITSLASHDNMFITLQEEKETTHTH